MNRRIEELEKACREHGLPVTVQRRIVFEAIILRQDHPTADQIYDQIKSRIPGVSRTTVYRILDTFVLLGLITKICHPGSAARFDPKIHQHHHLVCMHCEKIIDLEAESLNHLVWPDVRGHDFEIRDYHIHFRGVCLDCRKARTALVSAPIRKKKSSIAAARRRPKLRLSTRKRRNKT